MGELQQVPLFRGLTRPAMYGGVPLPWYSVVFLLGTTSFLILPWKIALGTVVAAYGLLFLVAQVEPKFFEILWVVLKKTPRTKNKSKHGGHLYRA